jgi:GAF domain
MRLECYREFLVGMDCWAYLTVPIYQGDRLWGLLATYQNSSPRDWILLEVQSIAPITEELGVAIQQAAIPVATFPASNGSNKMPIYRRSNVKPDRSIRSMGRGFGKNMARNGYA